MVNLVYWNENLDNTGFVLPSKSGFHARYHVQKRGALWEVRKSTTNNLYDFGAYSDFDKAISFCERHARGEVTEEEMRELGLSDR